MKGYLMDNFGKTFRKLRVKNKLTLADFESLGISTSSLAKFERGQSYMSFDRVVRGLKKMKVSLKEFETFSSYEDKLILELENAILKNEISKVAELSKQAFNRDERLLYLAALYMTNDRDRREEMYELEDRLREVSLWGRIELSALLVAMESMDSHLLQTLLEKSGDSLVDSIDVRKQYVKLLYHAEALFCGRGERRSAGVTQGKIESELERIGERVGLELRCFGSFAEGYLKECFGDRTEGMRLEREVLEILVKLEAYELLDYCQSCYQKWTGKTISRR